MNRLLGRLGRGWTYARVMGRAVHYGDLFPREGRASGAPSPGGTADPGGERLASGAPFVVTEHRFPVSGLAEPVEILQLSDVHLREADARLGSTCAALRSVRADLVAITGDVVARGWSREAVDRFLGALPPARLGRWACMGNWEHWSDCPPDRWGGILGEHGVVLLVDRWRAAGPLVVAGTDDLLAGRPDLGRALGGRPPGRPTVVLSHCPALFPEIARPGVALVLSGHTHGGQVRIPGLGAAWVPRGSMPYVAGWYREGATWMFVSRGMGWSIAPLRLRCPAEIARIRLEPADVG